jgi:hypothetical protein
VDLLLRLQTLLRNFSLQVVTRLLTHGVTQAVNFLVQRQLVDDGMAAQVAAFVPFVLASILVETAFSWLQRRWNTLQIRVAREMPSGTSKAQLNAEVMAELRNEVTTGGATGPVEDEPSTPHKGVSE